MANVLTLDKIAEIAGKINNWTERKEDHYIDYIGKYHYGYDIDDARDEEALGETRSLDIFIYGLKEDSKIVNSSVYIYNFTRNKVFATYIANKQKSTQLENFRDCEMQWDHYFGAPRGTMIPNPKYNPKVKKLYDTIARKYRKMA